MRDEQEQIKVLVADDDEVMARAIARSLESECAGVRCVVRRCGNGEEALELLLREGFDCAFLDYRMPGMDGLGVLKAARAAGVRTAMVILTGEGNEELAVEVMKAGAMDYLVKGRVTPEVLGQALRHAGRMREAESRLAAAEGRRWESEERFRRLVEVAEDGIWILGDDDRTVFVNAAATGMIGYSAAELLGRSPLEFMDPSSRPSTEKGLRDRRKGERQKRDCLMRHKDGHGVWTVVSAAPLTTPGGAYQGSFAVLRDVTWERETELALRESEERFRRVFEDGPVGMAMTGLDRRLIAVNAAFGKLVGRDPASLVGVNFDDITHPDDVTTNVQWAERVRRHEVPAYQLQKRYVRPDGTFVWASLTSTVVRERSGRPAYMLTIVEDVTERRKAEEELKASEARFRLLFEASPIGVVMQVGGMTLYANPAYVKMFGYERPEEVLGRSVLDLVAPSERGKVADRIERRGRGETGVPPVYETVGVRRDGTEFPYQVRVGRMPLPEGQANIAFLTDMTEPNRMRERLSQVERMESLGRLAGGIAHDFNNLLAVISGYAEALGRRVSAGDDEAARGQVVEIERAAERGARLVKQLLAFSRREAARRERLDVSRAVDGVCEMLRQVIGRRVEVERKADAQAAWVEGDPGQIEQMVLNLALNARDAMPEGGRVTIGTSVLETPAVEGSHPAGRFVVLTVADTGTGMDAATRSKMFEPFFTTKSDGTGLGLAIVYGIVEQLGGHVSVCSEEGKGTRFEILLPAV